MKFIDFLNVASSGTSAASLTLAAGIAGGRTLAQAIADGDAAVGDTDVVLVVVDSAGNREMGLYSIDSETQVTRTQVLRNAAGGTAAVTFNGSALTVYSDVPADYLNGQSLTDYLANNPGGAALATDILLAVRGNAVVGVLDSAIAALCTTLWRKGTETIVPIQTTDPLTLDSIPHNRNRLVCTATPSSIVPADYASIGDGFTCRVENLSGADIPLSGMTVRPSGTVLPSGGWVNVWATDGAVYADVGGLAAGSGSAVAPGAVGSFTAGTSGSTTQVLNWTAPATGTAPITYKVEYSLAGAGTWAQAATGVTGLTTTVNGLTASTAYDYRITPSNGAGTGASTTLPNVSTAAASGGGSAPFTVTLNGTTDPSFPYPAVLPTYTGSYFAQLIDATGVPTIASVDFALSASNTVAPTSGITMADATPGVWIGALTQYGTPANQYMGTSGAGVSYSITSSSPVNLYGWTFVKDSDGVTHTFVSTVTVQVYDGATVVGITNDTPCTLVS